MHPSPIKTALFAVFLFVGAYAAGYYGSKTPVAPGVASEIKSNSILALFICPEGRSIAADFEKESVHLSLSDGRTLTLSQALSASGARYATADESFVFWNKGDTAFVQEKGDMVTYHDCIDAKTISSQESPQVNVTVTPLSVIEDSRCPANANCIWAGRVRVRARVTAGKEVKEEIFTQGEPKTVLGKTITLTGVEPQKVLNKEYKFSDYTFTFDVK